MSVVFMKYTDSFVLFQCKCNHTTDSISPRRTAAAQRGDWKTSACSVSPRGLRGPRAVVGVGTGDTKFSCFSQTLPCSQPSCGFSFCVLTFQTSHTYSFSHSHSFFLVLSHSHLFSHTLTYSHVLTLTCSLSHTRPHTCSHTHALVHTQALSPLSRPSSCPCFPLFKDRLAPPSGPPMGPFPGNFFLGIHISSQTQLNPVPASLVSGFSELGRHLNVSPHFDKGPESKPSVT